MGPRAAGQTETERLCGAVAVLERGGVVGYPSETVWGLAARPDSEAAVGRLYALKGREATKPVQLSCLHLTDAWRWLRPGQEGAEALARFWPGPLTLLAWAAPDCPEWLAPGGVVGLRLPSHPVIRALLGATGGTLATTSLNPSGEPAASTLEQAAAYGLADLLLSDDMTGGDRTGEATGAGEGGEALSSGVASTVFDLRSRRVTRQGAVTEAALRQALGERSLGKAVTPDPSDAVS